MSDWEPATEAEAAMRDALAAADQERYFRILARTELLLPVSADAMAGRAQMGWGTWTTGNRTHVLAFTSGAALVTCLNEHAGSRKLPFHELASEWPNYEWWLAVNPGLPIEAYLPSWFVAQLTRGDVRLPGRTMGARARIAQSDLAAALNGRIRASAPAPTARATTSVPTQPSRSSIPPVITTAGADPGNGREPHLDTIEAEIIDGPPASPSGSVSAGQATAPVRPESGPTLSSGQMSPPGPVSGSARVPRSSSYPPPDDVPAWERGPAEAPRFWHSVPPDDPPRPTPAPPLVSQEPEEAQIVSPAEPFAADTRVAGFAPANETEANLLAAAEVNNTDAFLSTLLLAQVILPVPAATPTAARPRDPDFPWQIGEADGQSYIAVFTSPERLADHGRSRFNGQITTVSLRFVELIAAWPSDDVSFAINPGSPVGATLPGSQIVALASWARQVGLRTEPSADIVVAAKKVETKPSAGVAGAPVVSSERATVMQRSVPPAQLPYYLDRGYDRVSGFVHRASEVAHLTTPRRLYRALGLAKAGSPFHDDDAEVHVVRWAAHRADLYRIPYGGQHEAGMRAMQGWVIEGPPFRGNGFAPGDSEVVAEFKVDSVRLPHGAQMWRLDKEGNETLVATFDADVGRWLRPDSPVESPSQLGSTSQPGSRGTPDNGFGAGFATSGYGVDYPATGAYGGGYRA